MNDRQALLSAIADFGPEDLPRLEYADWLQEHGTTDLDRATVEFIRVSCSMRTTTLMPAAAYAWLAENWQRLVPSVLALAPEPPPDDESQWKYCWEREGRVIVLNIRLPYPASRAKSGLRVCPMRLDFHRGLLRQAVVWSSYALGLTLDAFAADQPVAFFKCPGLNGVGGRTIGTVAADPDLRENAQAMYRAMHRKLSPLEVPRA